jgi:phage terminase large subunit
MAKTHLPPSCGADLNKPLKFNKFQQAFQQARRKRFCIYCKTTGSMDATSLFRCIKCKTLHTSNLTAPRVYSRLMLRAGRRGGKSLIGAHAAREEMMVPNSLGWVCAPTYRILHDATMPTLLRLIPPDWVKNWNQDRLELTLHNGAMVVFRSLDDPTSPVGMGCHWAWFDEAARIQELAWDTFRPSLSDNAGIAFFTTTPMGFDWSYRRFMKPALIDHKPGFWACRFKTIDNPIFRENKVLMQEVEEARATMPPDLFAQDYEGEDVNFTGSIYGQMIDRQILPDAEAVRGFIEEWPDIRLDRPCVIGLDSGADHPFGASLLVATPKGMVAVGEYLKRMQAMVTHLASIQHDFGTASRHSLKWAANKNEAQLRLEFGLRGVGVIPAESKQEVGIQRVQSWLHTRQLWFAYSVPRTIEQMKALRYATNTTNDGQKREKEKVFKLEDELPDALRYALMAWPELPRALEEGDAAAIARWKAMDPRMQQSIERVREYEKQTNTKDLEEGASGYPIGDFFSTVSDAF